MLILEICELVLAGLVAVTPRVTVPAPGCRYSQALLTRAVDRILKSRIKSDLKSRIKSDLSDFLTGRKPLLLWSF